MRRGTVLILVAIGLVVFVALVVGGGTLIFGWAALETRVAYQRAEAQRDLLEAQQRQQEAELQLLMEGRTDATRPLPPDRVEVVQPSSPPALPTESGAPSYEQVAMAWRGRKLDQAQVLDANGGRPYRIDLFAGSDGVVDRAWIDLDRDGKIDERWSLTGAETRREVAPADDEHYTLTQVWDGQGWRTQPTP